MYDERKTITWSLSVWLVRFIHVVDTLSESAGAKSKRGMTTLQINLDTWDLSYPQSYLRVTLLLFSKDCIGRGFYSFSFTFRRDYFT